MVSAQPPRDEMLAAFTERDGSYDGVFVAAVRTTGIFCRSSCPARKPDPRNVEFFATAGTALAAGYRPCLRCRPLDPGGSAPEWLGSLLAELERDPRRRWTDADLATSGLRPEAVRRWFRRRFGMTFHGYARARRLAAAVGNLQRGAPVTDTAFDHGYESLSGFNDAIRNLIGASPGEAGAAMLLAVAPVETPLGLMLLGAVDGKLCLAEFSDQERLERQLRRVGQLLNATPVPGREPPIDCATRCSWRNISPAVAATSSFPCCPPVRSCNAKSGRRCCRSRMERPGPTARSRQRSAVRARPDP